MNPGDAVEIARHYHAWIVVTFIAGYGVHVLGQIDAVARSKNNPVSSRIRILEQNWIRLLYRFTLSLLIFTGVWIHPDIIATFLTFIRFDPSANLTAILTIPITVWFAGVWGFAVDGALAFIPILKNFQPPIEGVQAQLLREASIATTKAQTQLAVAKEAVEEAKVIPPDPKPEKWIDLNP